VAEEPKRRIAVAGWVLLALVLWWPTTGIISSNDGSHVALGRALVVRHETKIDPEVALTLWVDRAKRDGHQYSDRPPGTAFAAIPALWIGNRLDPSFLRSSLESKDIVVSPAGARYLEVYTTRPAKVGVRAIPILAYQGTALAVGLHTVLMGLLGLWAVARLLARRNVDLYGRAFAVGGLGLATLWGPYATALFSHVTAGTMVALMLVALDALRDAEFPRRRTMLAAAAGLAAAWAASTDYLVGLLALGTGLATVDLRKDARLIAVAVLGAIPVLAATAAYHDAAFGSPLAIGYDHHANFDFARDRGETFSGNPLSGLWIQWGFGEGAGMLALAPLSLFGVVGLARSPWRRLILGALPWVIVLAFHRTPAGGGSEDHRYLVPLLPILGVGLGALWQALVVEGAERGRLVGTALVLVAVASAFLAWSHFLGIVG